MLHHLLSATLIHLSARMTPSSLHVFWSSSCHTLALQSLPYSSFFCLFPHSHWLMTCPPPLRALRSQQQPLVIYRNQSSPCQQGVFNLRSLHRRPGSEWSTHIQRTVESSMYSSTAHWSIGPLLWFVSIFILHKVLSALPSHVKHTCTDTHMHTQRLYIDLNSGIITDGRGVKH